MKRKWMRAVVPMMCACNPAAGAPLRLGLTAGAARLSVADPDGPTAKATAPDFGVVAMLGWARDTRLQLAADRQAATLAASTTDVGERVERTGVSLSYQERWRLSYHLKPWLGIGLGYAHEVDTLRHTIDSGGFLAAAYPDRAQGVYDAVVTADESWRWIRGWRIGMVLCYQAPLTAHAATALGASVMLSRRIF